MNKLTALAAVAVLALAGCGSSTPAAKITATPAVAATTQALDADKMAEDKANVEADADEKRIRDAAPAFEVVQAPTFGSGGGEIRVNVDATLTEVQADSIMELLKIDFINDDGGYFVSINCSTGGTDKFDNRLANGKMAVGMDSRSARLGQARTGLTQYSVMVEMVEGRTCPVNIPTSPADSLTAQQVIDGFAAAGLPVTDARDNTGSNCSDRGCAEMITTEDVTVLSFPDAAAASVYVKTWGPADLHRLGAIVLSYGAARTPAVARPRYEAALVALKK